ncbi:hypothetical protein HTZ97_13660 [Desulfuromonas acetoxidans]|uniref:hypothetical protein n=1 Tax=Desulfuromonas acetoxidans TaxID=891 RepID=UPI0015933F8D|nr:hypothetical protein [Desulfuromonas acetoxidans]MBF0644883.1 hypothetical protein [Desulfuromonas acetoxidans]NVD25400.1 hypothetical protein [Desulfuromonas acetoxidans]NVE17499.1 hypothetical protein [Desulfuromonas acetoxidans]
MPTSVTPSRYQFTVYKSDSKRPFFRSGAVDFDTMVADLGFMDVDLLKVLNGRGLDAYACTVYPARRPFGIRRVDVRSFSVLGGVTVPKSLMLIENRPKRTPFEADMIQRCWTARRDYRFTRSHVNFEACRHELGEYHGFRRSLLSYRRFSVRGEV